MRLKSKFAIAIAIAALLVAVSAVAAFAAASQESVALQVGDEMGAGFSGAYGDEVVLQPACMSKIELPGDKFHFQVYINDVDASGTPVGQVWKDFGEFEDVQIEDTNTVAPFGFRLGVDDWVILGDGSAVHPTFPYQIRCEYKPNVAGLDASGTPKAGSSTSPPSYSETETVNLLKNMYTKTTHSRRSSAARRYHAVFPRVPELGRRHDSRPGQEDRFQDAHVQPQDKRERLCQQEAEAGKQARHLQGVREVPRQHLRRRFADRRKDAPRQPLDPSPEGGTDQ